MRKVISDYIESQRVGVLAIEMMDGSPHAATVHFAHIAGPFTLFFETYRDSHKAQALFGRAKSRASFVLGTDETTNTTVQIDGVAELISIEGKELFDSVYFKKFPKKVEKSKDPKFVCFKFTPTWYRYTSWTKEHGKEILLSENIDVLDKDGNKTGEVRTIDDVHWYGFWHCSARVWVVNSKKEVLLQHRDKASIEFPDTWDASAAGHVTAGHDVMSTALNEAKEELGLNVVESDLKLIDVITKQDVSRDGEYKDNSFEHIYLVQKDVELSDMQMQQGEVQNLKWIPISEFQKMVEERSPELVPHWDEYELLLSVIAK